MMYYSICSLIVEADTLPQSYQPFLISNETRPKDIDLSIKRIAKPLSSGHRQKIAELPFIIIWKELFSGDRFRWIYEARNGFGTLSVDADYTHAELYCLDLFNRFAGELSRPFIQLLIECKLIKTGISVLHSACVELNGIAYAFTGPSGIGKSSRAGKWCELFSAEWISGDRPAIDGDRAIVYGVPWDGKEAIHRNVSRPLGAILKVKRSCTTQIREMAEGEKFQLLSEQTFFPLWDTELAAISQHSLKRLIHSVPIYELSGDITDESMRKAYGIIQEALKERKGETP